MLMTNYVVVAKATDVGIFLKSYRIDGGVWKPFHKAPDRLKMRLMPKIYRFPGEDRDSYLFDGVSKQTFETKVERQPDMKLIKSTPPLNPKEDIKFSVKLED